MSSTVLGICKFCHSDVIRRDKCWCKKTIIGTIIIMKTIIEIDFFYIVHV